MANTGNQNGRKISRREFLHLTAAAVAGAVAMAPGPIASSAMGNAAATHGTAEGLAGRRASPADVQVYKEAPMLAALVQQGRLPPVDQRLPVNPCILAVLDQAGKYDNLMNRAFKGASDFWGPTKMVDHAWGWFDKELNLVPRMLESWTVSPDGKVWTLKMREGLKWSDGKAEYTADDISFWYQHELQNTKLTPTPLSQWTDPDGALVQFAAVDKYTCKFTYTEPKPMFMYGMTRGGTGGAPTMYPLPVSPSHYMKELHEDTTSDQSKLAADIVARGFTDWQSYYMQFARQWTANPDRPTLGPWLAKNTLNEDLFVMERNPYYYCVDADDNQLPYVDFVTHKLFSTDAEFTARVQSGAVDFQGRHASFVNYNAYKASELAGRYHVVLSVGANHVAIQLNMTTPTSARLRVFFRDARVRKALSLAVNRAYLNNQFYNGLAAPRQYSPLSTSPQYYGILSNAYIAYDVTQANALLDDAGYTTKDGQGYRLWNDGSGERISFVIEGTAESSSAEGQAVQQVVLYYAAVGIQAAYQTVDRATYTNHYQSNQIEAAWWGGDRTVLPLVDPGIFLGVQLDRPWAVAWGAWRNNPANPITEEPPAGHWIRDIWSKWDQIAVEPSETQRNALFRDILDIWAEQLPMIGYLGEIPQPVIVKDGLHNYDAGYPYDDTTADEELLNPETNYWDSTLVPALSINYTSGSPGSFFTVTGVGYPPNSTAMISINGHAIQSLLTDGFGNIEFVLNTGQANVGYYGVTVSVNPSASTAFSLAQNAPQRQKESAASEVNVPETIGIARVHLPFILR